ncbi:alpha/beta fold hydrolase [Blastococcus goldschmidtiae]|uniref:Uncharacterized protein n=1 Tax=Blastococcus goldschmidtiae TaxID=3075546 RepID=A0ABU2K7P9_9ACTN|nr:hypothetical protein [Blastococcus sp. DSM 46792]MDT0276199.1 hypothetical protein [Blastococcus sp. DSM 46792]
MYAVDTPRALIEEDFAVRSARPTSVEGDSAQMQGALRHGAPSRGCPALHGPVVVLHGTADRLVPQANAHLFHRALPDARL